MADKELILGVDFGTTNSKIAIAENSGIRLVQYPRGKDNYIPTAVAYRQFEGKEEIIVGRSARTRFDHREAVEFCEDFKMLLPLDEPKDWSQQGWRSSKSPEQVTVDYFRQLLFDDPDSFQNQFGPIGHVVFSVPEVWQRQTNRGAEKLLRLLRKDLKLTDVHLQSEPVCAAVYYAAQTESRRQKNEEYDLLVCDMGGGTFDVTFCHVIAQDRQINVLDFDGNGQQGFGAAGVAFDRRVVTQALSAAGEAVPSVNDVSFTRLVHGFQETKIGNQQDAERAFLAFKNNPAYDEAVVYTLARPESTQNYELTRKQVTTCFADIRPGIIDVLKSLDERNRLRDRRFEIALVGGFGSFPLVEKTILDYFKIQEHDPRFDPTLIRNERDGDFRLHAVAKGAALIAKRSFRVKEPYPHTIGLMVHTLVRGAWEPSFLPIVQAGTVNKGELEGGKPKVTFATREGGRVVIEVDSQVVEPLPVRIQYRGRGDLRTVPLPQEEYPAPGEYCVGVTIDASNLVSLIFEPITSGLTRREYRLGELKMPPLVDGGRVI